MNTESSEKKVCVVTGSRADYGLLYRLLVEISKSSSLKLQLVATGMHLSSEFGNTAEEIEQDGFKIDEKVEALLSSDTSIGVCKSLGLTVIGLSEALARLEPAIVILLGDRFEIFAAAAAATVLNLPIAHIHGGERGEGAFDEAFRHSISKMAHMHFVATEEYKKRVIQLGENPEVVLNVGALGVENIATTEFFDKESLERTIGIKLQSLSFLVTWHPVTLEPGRARDDFQELLDALDNVKDSTLIFTKANADTEGREVNKMIDHFVSKKPDVAVAVKSLGRRRYLSLLRHVSGVIGNSSSGIIEAPSIPTGTINIGQRQRGRVRAPSIIDCESKKDSILEAIEKILSKEFQEQVQRAENPHGSEQVARKIVSAIEAAEFGDLLKKEFFDLR